MSNQKCFYRVTFVNGSCSQTLVFSSCKEAVSVFRSLVLIVDNITLSKV